MHAVRAGLALVLVPVLLADQSPRASQSMLEAVAGGAAVGAAFGLSATVVVGAVSSAGSLIDAGLVWAPLSDRPGTGGAVAFLYQLLFAVIFLESGGFATMVKLFARASSHLPSQVLTIPGVVALGTASVQESVLFAAPALLAQSCATLLAGLLSRAAPQINGMMMSAPLICAGVGLGLFAGARMLAPEFVKLVSELLVLLGPR